MRFGVATPCSRCRWTYGLSENFENLILSGFKPDGLSAQGFGPTWLYSQSSSFVIRMQSRLERQVLTLETSEPGR
jgi:hypothetical protein